MLILVHMVLEHMLDMFNEYEICCVPFVYYVHIQILVNFLIAGLKLWENKPAVLVITLHMV